MLLGQETAGSSVSVTVTVKEQSALWLPAVARQVFVVVPMGKVAPEAKPASWLSTAPSDAVTV